MSRSNKNSGASSQGDSAHAFLPMSRQDMADRGWGEVDVVVVTGDAYVDHPAFAPALLGRMLEHMGYRVGIIARPRPGHPEDMAQLGKPRLFFAVAPGAVDSMVNNYTAQKRPRRSDDYAPGGQGGGRPNRALIVYCNMIRQEFGKSVAILGGGIEASLRRFAHYDYWADSVRRPVLLDAPADALAFGMGEYPLEEISRAMASYAARDWGGMSPGEALTQIARKVDGVVWRCAASEPKPDGYYPLPDFEYVRDDGEAEVRAFNTEAAHRAGGVYQDCAGHRVVANPPSLPLDGKRLDALYDLPFMRKAHPSYREPIPALAQIQFSVASHRGCFGGCAFCGIASHQGKTIQSRSAESILGEVERMTHHPEFKGTVRDIGGATSNMWGLGCTKEGGCDRPSCLAPEICRFLNTNQKPYLNLLTAARKIEGVKHLFVSSGIRMDLALECPALINALAEYHTSGYARVAPEHLVSSVLRIMGKPAGKVFADYLRRFRKASDKAGKEQYVLPYFMAAHPGSHMEDMIKIALFLKDEGLRVEQCQIFTPTPGTAATVMYHTGINPYTGKNVFVERSPKRRELQKALVLYHLPENRNKVTEALAMCDKAELAHTLLPRHAPRPSERQRGRPRRRKG
jgi:uncharacterized radical SAM protein YgiQ